MPSHRLVTTVVCFWVPLALASPAWAAATHFCPPSRVLSETNPRAQIVYQQAMASATNAPASVWVVSDPGDQPDDSLADGILDPPTLRAAVENANRFPDLDMITFAPSLGMVSKTTTNWPNVVYPVILDGMIADSGRVAIDGTTQPAGGGLVFLNGGHTIKNCEFRNFESWGILLQANGGNTNIVQNCVFRDNGNAGINFNGSTKNLIGGALPGERNYIYGNDYGMTLIVGSDSNTIMGNYIGTPDGETADGNTSYGIWIETRGNYVSGNLISGNGSSGIYTDYPQAGGNVFEMNLIGLDKDGIGPLGNASGIAIGRGGADTVRGNVISGNTYGGVAVGTNIPDIVIEENFIGTDELGTYPVPNGGNGIGTAGRRAIIRGNLLGGNSNGIEIYGGDSTIIRDNIIGDYDLSTTPLGNTFFGVSVTGGRGHRIGGPGEEDGNLISGNRHSGIRLFGTSVTECVIEGNLIGTSSSGLLALGNDSSGIHLRTSTKRDTIRNNVICGNGLDGILMSIPIDTLPGEHVVTGNLIGIAADSTTILPNHRFGIQLDSARGSSIGATGFPGNTIAGNDSSGVRLLRSRQNVISGNLIGVLPDSTTAAGNGGGGMSLIRANGNRIGGRDPGEGNILAENAGPGIRIHSGTGNRIVGNVIRDNSLIGVDLVGQDLTRGITLNDSADADTGANHLQNYPTLTCISRSTGNAIVSGFLEGTQGETYTIDFYSVVDYDVSGFGGSDSLLDSLAVTPDSTGVAHFMHTLTGNPPNIIATATAPDGSTSEFSKSAIMVNTSDDAADLGSNDAICNSGGSPIYGVPPCALRAAIELAEHLLGPDYIGFDITGLAPISIFPDDGLPHVTEPTVIDGTTQPGYIEGTPAIRLGGASAGAAAGLYIEDNACSIRGMSLTDFQEQGIRCIGNLLKLHDIKATGNVRSGIWCDGSLSVTGPLVASLNGTQVDDDAGVDVAGVLRTNKIEASGNHGRGINAGWLSVEGDLTADDNDAAGARVVHEVLIRGEQHSTSNNGYDGIVSLNGWVVVEGGIVADNNGNVRTPSECLTLKSAGLSANKEIVLEQSTITGNCGHGLSSGSFAWLKGNCTIQNNTEIGLFATGGEVRLDGAENVISDNGKTGLLCNNGIVRVAGLLTLNNNGTTVEVEDPGDCLPGLGDPDSESGAHGLYASELEANTIVSTNNCGAGVAGGEVSISGSAKLDGNSSHGAAARIVRIAAGEACYNGGYGVIVLNPGGIVAGGVLSLGAVKICMNELGGVFVRPNPPTPMTLSATGWNTFMVSSSSNFDGGSITDNLGSGIDWQAEDSLIVNQCNVSGNGGSGIAAASGAGPVTASDVWWGSADGPGGAGPGSGDEVSGGVDFSGWSSSMHALSLSAEDNLYVAPGSVDSIWFSLSKWTVGSEQINIHIIDTANWINGPIDFVLPVSDTVPVVSALEIVVPGGTPDASQAEIRIVATADTDSSVTDTCTVTVFTYLPQLTSMMILPDSVSLLPGETVNFYAFGFDQAGSPYPFPAAWATDGGTITAGGLFTATNSPGNYTVSVTDTSGLVSAEAVVQVLQACACDCHADPQCDSATTIFDVVIAIDEAFRNAGPNPDPNPLCPIQTTDVNCDGVTNVFDIVLLVNVAFRNADPAAEFCAPCP